jgi:hypothetical protein
MSVERTTNTQTQATALLRAGRRWAIAALLLLPAVRASASSGYISVYYSIEGVGESSYTLNHADGASEGLDDNDTIWYFIACLSCRTDTKVVSSVDGEDLKIDTRPVSSESGVSVRCSAVAKDGGSVAVNHAAQWVEIYTYGFEGYEVTVDGRDARTTSRIDLNPVTGTFSSGETITTLSISFTRKPGYEPPDPPADPDPGQDEEPGVSEPAPDALYITNLIEGWSQGQTGAWTLVHNRAALDAIDANDAAYDRPASANRSSLVVSSVAEPATGERHLLTVDARPPAGVREIDLFVGVESASSGPIQFGSPTANKLVFSFPAGAKDPFAGKPITFQQYDPADPSASYPIWDIRKIIAGNQGILALDDLRGSLASGIPYLCAHVSTSRQPGDILRDGRIDVNDYRLVVLEQGLTGPADTDVASPKGLGLPDGAVDAWDLHYLYELLTDAEKAEVTPPVLPVLTEGFESGGLAALNWSSLQGSKWFVTSDDRHSGAHSARAGRITHGEITTLSLTLDCTAGRISFWRKVSTEYNWDNYRFYIDNKLQEKLSGEVAWSEASFPIEAGRHIFRWEYEKDDAMSCGQDTVYLDDLTIPAVP